jgi:hypothetical protein
MFIANKKNRAVARFFLFGSQPFQPLLPLATGWIFAEVNEIIHIAGNVEPFGEFGHFAAFGYGGFVVYLPCHRVQSHPFHPFDKWRYFHPTAKRRENSWNPLAAARRRENLCTLLSVYDTLPRLIHTKRAQYPAICDKSPYRIYRSQKQKLEGYVTGF